MDRSLDSSLHSTLNSTFARLRHSSLDSILHSTLWSSRLKSSPPKTPPLRSKNPYSLPAIRGKNSAKKVASFGCAQPLYCLSGRNQHTSLYSVQPYSWIPLSCGEPIWAWKTYMFPASNVSPHPRAIYIYLWIFLLYNIYIYLCVWDIFYTYIHICTMIMHIFVYT